MTRLVSEVPSRSVLTVRISQLTILDRIQEKFLLRQRDAKALKFKSQELSRLKNLLSASLHETRQEIIAPPKLDCHRCGIVIGQEELAVTSLKLIITKALRRRKTSIALW